MTEPLDLDALRALTDAATPGPWSVDRIDPGWVNAGDGWLAAQSVADAAFIAAAREGVPALIDEVARLRAVVASVEALHRPRMVPTSGSPNPRHEATWTTVCDHCGPLRWPCVTAAALTAAQDAPAPTPTEED